MDWDKRLTLSLTERQLQDVDEMVGNENEKYQNRNHFIRCAIIKLLKEERM